MATTILTTKLYVPPPRPDWVSRPRLIERLDQGLSHRLTVVCAPAGFGKTTLLTSWLRDLVKRSSAAPRLAWLSLEEDESAPVRFIAYLTAALQTLEPGIGQTAQSLLDAPQPAPANHLMTLLINDVAELSGSINSGIPRSGRSTRGPPTCSCRRSPGKSSRRYARMDHLTDSVVVQSGEQQRSLVCGS